jgi:uncharacterized Rossmann fold enzyme
VQFVTWFPYYQDIRSKFGYSTEKDQNSAYLLSKKINRKFLDPDVLRKKIQGKSVIVIGSGPDLKDYLQFIKKNRSFIKIVADGTVKFIIENGIKPDIVVTDLDGDPKFLYRAENLGATMVVHAHGDNVTLVEKLVPKFKKVLGTTQVMPVKNVYNYGGFTDGDRAVFLAEEFGAKEIILVGMSFDSAVGEYSKSVYNTDIKKEKLKVAKRLLQTLAKNSRSILYDTSKRPISGFKEFPSR